MNNLIFCFYSNVIRPSVIAAINSAAYHNRTARVIVYADKTTIDLYKPYTTQVDYIDIASYFKELQTETMSIAVRRMRAFALLNEGGWYIDAFDTLTLKELPEVTTFTIGEECWTSGRLCAGVCASPINGIFAKDWLQGMLELPEQVWDHWTDQSVCQRLAADAQYNIDKLSTERINWISESGFTGELRISEDQINALLDKAWIIHYFGRGAFNQEYKGMDFATIRRCSELFGWIPSLILKYCDIKF